jgi:hypothetical protein
MGMIVAAYCVCLSAYYVVCLWFTGWIFRWWGYPNEILKNWRVRRVARKIAQLRRQMDRISYRWDMIPPGHRQWKTRARLAAKYRDCNNHINALKEWALKHG